MPVGAGSFGFVGFENVAGLCYDEAFCGGEVSFHLEEGFEVLAEGVEAGGFPVGDAEAVNEVADVEVLAVHRRTRFGWLLEPKQ